MAGYKAREAPAGRRAEPGKEGAHMPGNGEGSQGRRAQASNTTGQVSQAAPFSVVLLAPSSWGWCGDGRAAHYGESPERLGSLCATWLPQRMWSLHAVRSSEPLPKPIHSPRSAVSLQSMGVSRSPGVAATNVAAGTWVARSHDAAGAHAVAKARRAAAAHGVAAENATRWVAATHEVVRSRVADIALLVVSPEELGG